MTARCRFAAHKTSMTRHLLAALAGLALTLPASWSSYAHELMSPNWCMGSQQEIQIISTFKFDKKNILLLLQEGTTHGVVDKYMTVSSNIALYCRAQQASLLGSDYDSRAIVTGPQNYLRPAHHQFYDPLTEGLVGGCAICVPVENPNAPGSGPSLDPAPLEGQP